MQLNYKIESLLNQLISKQQQQNKMINVVSLNTEASTTSDASPTNITNMDVDNIKPTKTIIKLEIDNKTENINNSPTIQSEITSTPSSPITITSNSQDNQAQVVANNTPPQNSVNQEDDSEIPAFAKILLNISANGIQVPNLSESSPAVLVGRLMDSSNGLVPFDLKSSDSGISTLAGSRSILDDDSENSYKKKRQRTSPEQLAILEQIFETDKMPSQQIRVRLANQLGMSSRRVQIWFQNKRAKVKRGGPFGKDDDYIEEDDEDLDDSNLTIDDTVLNTSSDNLVPSISPILSSVNLSQSNNNNNNNNNNNILSATGSPIIPSFNLNLSNSNIKLNNTNILLPTSTSTSTSPLLSSIVPSPLKKIKRPPSPTSTSNLNFSSINLTSSNNSISLNNSSTSIPSLLQIKLNSSSNHIPSLNNNNNSNTNNSSNIENISTNNNFSDFSSLKFNNILKNN